MSKIVNLTDVFISYSRRNTAFARKLNDELRKCDMEVWADWNDIPKGADWRAEIQAGVEGANAFLFIISPDSVKSAECRHEVELAVANGKRFVPVLHVDLNDAESKAALHPAIGKHNWIFARETDNWEQAFQEIVDTIRTDLDHVRAHTRFGVRAQEWEHGSRDPSFLLTGKEILEAETWLNTSVGKSPEATQLHNDYIFASRQEAIKRQRRVLGGVVAALVVSVLLLFVSIALGIEAENQRQTAVQARATAVRNADISSSTAMAFGAGQINFSNQIEAVSVGLQAVVTISNPPALSQRVLSEVAYQPGARRVFEGHDDAITSVEISPDGTLAISASEDESLMLWDLETGSSIRKMEGHSGQINRAVFNPDGTLVLSASDDETAILWNVETGEIIRQFEGHEDRVLNAAFHPDGKRIVTASRDRTLILWDVESGEVVRRFEGHSGRVFAVAISPDGQTMASGDSDSAIILWNIESGEQIRQLIRHSDTVYTLGFSPDGERLISGSGDGTLILWNVDSGELLSPLIGHVRAVRSATFSPDGNYLLSGSDDRTILLWNASNGQILHTYTGLDFVRGLSFSPDGTTFLSGSRDRRIILWDVFAGSVLREYVHTDEVWTVDFSLDGKWIASGANDRVIMVKDAATGELVRLLDQNPDLVNTVTFSPDATRLAASFEDGTIIVWPLPEGDPLWSVRSDAPVRTLDFSPDGKTLISGDSRGQNGAVTLWDAASGEVLKVFNAPDGTGTSYSVAFNPAGDQFASAYEANTVMIWSIDNTEQPVQVLNGHTNAVYSVAYSPDGSRLLSGGVDQTVILWDVASGEIIRRFVAHSGVVRSVDFSPTGNLFASAADDRLVFLWSPDELDPLRSYAGHSDSVYSVTFAPDEKSILSGSRDREVIQWRIDTLETLVEWTGNNRYIARIDCNTQRQFGLTLDSECNQEE